MSTKIAYLAIDVCSVRTLAGDRQTTVILLGDGQGDGGFLLHLSVSAAAAGGGVSAADKFQRDSTFVSLVYKTRLYICIFIC